MHSHSEKGFSVKEGPFVKELDFIDEAQTHALGG